jgi:hypothetical protein
MFVPLLMALFVSLVQSQGARTRIDVSKVGPQVGERVPAFRLVDQTGKAQTLQSIMGRRGAMLVFVRSADW